MEITEAQITFIRNDLHRKGITMNELSESLVDHICCAIESETNTDFDAAYARALAAFGEGQIAQIQKEALLFINLKKELAMKKTMYVLGFIAVFLTTSGLLFKIQHWPGAAIMLTLGIVLLNFGFLPMYFYDRYRQATN